MVFNFILMGLGAIFSGYGVYVIITKKYNKSKEKDFTKESLVKSSVVEGIFDIICGVGIILAGLGQDAKILPTFVYYTGFGIAIAALIADSIIESKVLVKIAKEEPKEEPKE